MKGFIFLWIFLIPIVLFAQIENQRENLQYQEVFVATDNFQSDYLDILEKRVLEIPEFSPLRLQILNDLGYYYHTRNLKKALGFIELGLREARESDENYWMGRLLVSKGAILLRMEELDQAEQVLNEAISMIPEQEAWLLYTNLGYVYERRGMLGKAFEYASKTLEIGETYRDQKAIAMAYSDMSNLFWKQQKFESAFFYGIKSLEIFESRGINDLDYDFTLHLVGQYLVDLERQEEAFPYFQKSVQLGEQYGFYNNLSDTYIALANLQANTGNFSEGEKSGLDALRYAELLENDFMIMRSYLALGKVSNEAGEYGQAARYLNTSIEKAKENFGDKYYLSLVYEELSKAYEGSNLFESALEASRIAYQLKSDVFTSEAEAQIATLQTEMQVAQKENTINLQESQLSRQRILQVLYLTLAIVLVVILSLVYRVYLRKKSYSELLEKKNQEKEFLLKEIHHRIKNNLETISSLLSLQIAKIDNRDFQQILEETYNRVQSMGMIHLQLYRQENLKGVEMKEFFENLGRFILDTFDAKNKINFDIEMKALELDVDLAIPIGLIVNELISNSLKYAFPLQEKGRILIKLYEKEGALFLEVADNGVGIVSNTTTQGTGFGSELISLLTRQLDGKMTLVKSPGTSFSFTFFLNKAA
ncbi:MAG: histidine kinase dimerization/phosphoacceptor domain -containing protein [Algoriphagus sp.]|uniref:histidine kinase dimerization/phosphoacceptor domain -containing protein n=1 Tax=Algoriphagus sp. TaxID=1872435 RepID=UPI00260CB12B|nr:histidine kinase dimerization/phosphoacceptor domain -containing protein [Algoriphagus sp.]MDG1276835.1 histidine kinase dimerization/phosphoacceptor domain -containing protein [Algoriphagus sp.]